MDSQEDTQARTMNWLMQSPVQAEARSEGVPEGDGLSNTLLVDAMEKGQSEEPPDSVADGSEHDRITDVHTDSSSDLQIIRDTAHLPVDVLAALSDPLTPVEVELEEVHAQN